MIIENLPTLKIHKLTKNQYDRELAAGRIDTNALYLVNNTEEPVYITLADIDAICGTIIQNTSTTEVTF